MTIRIVTEGGPRSRAGNSTIRHRIDRELHGAVVRASDAKVAPLNTYAIEDVRRGRRSPWRGMLSVYDHLRALGAPKHFAKVIVQLQDAYVDELYDSDHGRAA